MSDKNNINNFTTIFTLLNSFRTIPKTVLHQPAGCLHFWPNHEECLWDKRWILVGRLCQCLRMEHTVSIQATGPRDQLHQKYNLCKSALPTFPAASDSLWKCWSSSGSSWASSLMAFSHSSLAWLAISPSNKLSKSLQSSSRAGYTKGNKP